MIVEIFDKDIAEILTIFCLSPGSRFLRKELKERTKLNNVNLDNAINTLLNSKIIKKEKKFLLLDFDYAKDIIQIISKQYKDLRELPLNIYFSVINIIFLLGKLKNIHVYLFGSYAKLVYKDTSDIDIAIVSDIINEEDKKKLNVSIQKVESRYGKKIEIHYFGMNFYKNKKDPIVKEIIKNGIRLI